jgi:HAD superfamily hydrolase (TIGR01509 family)
VTLTTVVLDVGETLVDETRQWQGWARWLGVPEFTLYGVIGGLAARSEDHREFVPLLKPGADFATERAAKEAAGSGWSDDALLYDDAEPALRALRADGWQLVVGGNQPVAFQRLVEALELPVDVVTSSGSLGVEKPDPAFYRAVAAAAGVLPSACVHVGDRVDNDLLGAREAGMAVVHVRRGPWGVLHGHRAAGLGIPQVTSLLELPPLLAGLRSPAR